MTPEEPSRRLEILARNLWWAWQPGLAELFRKLSATRWRSLGHNPIALLSDLGDGTLAQRITEAELARPIDDATERLQSYLASKDTWVDQHATDLAAKTVAYFCAEFGLHESLPIYSGGLGVLAGDHLKTASDLGIRMVGIGLLYREGYFRQTLDAEGWQQEAYVANDPAHMPLQPATDAAGQPIVVSVETGTGTLHAGVWSLAVGRSRLLLLDADVKENAPEDRTLTDRLYSGAQGKRIRQEVLLGIGGLRALHAAGVDPAVIHLNEGHSAFVTLELARHLCERDRIDAAEALRRATRKVVFTTHTPVEAGHDRFPPELVHEQLSKLGERLGLSPDELIDLGRVTTQEGERFCMTTLALKHSCRANGVSALHGRVSRRMWRNLWPRSEEGDVPIGHVTNGVHVSTWLAPEMRALFDLHFPEGWLARAHERESWAEVDAIDPAELWRARAECKTRLIGKLGEPFRVDALLVGFARRFAIYKRAGLLFRDLDRLEHLVNRPGRPLRLVLAGKAHPRDADGKKLLQSIVHLTRDPRFAGRILFLENYDLDIARYLVQGTDVWLNTPRPPMEASGTSGEKAALNGALNLSILDGWWAEGYDGTNGFAIGGQGDPDDQSPVEQQDARDTEALFRTLEEEVIPLYYDRDADGLPRRWIERMKACIRTLGWRFSADRMLIDYARQAYAPVVRSATDE